jgi:hypothetical protein
MPAHSSISMGLSTETCRIEKKNGLKTPRHASA